MTVIQRPPDRAWRWQQVSLVVLALAVIMPLLSPGAAEPADQPSQCVRCHTDAARLKALTPPDLPPTEEGEG